MTTMNPRVWAVVLGWDHVEDTLECLESLRRSENIALQPLYVDNGSNPDTVARVVEACPDTIVIRHPQNVGVSRGFNGGLAFALQRGAEFVFMANNDTIMQPDTLCRLIAAADAEPQAGILVPKIYYHGAPGVLWSAGARFRRVPPVVVMQKTSGPDDGRYDRQTNLEFTTLCTVLVRGQALRAAGLMNPNFIVYCEDYELAQRVRDAGYTIRLVPQARTLHKVERVTREGSSKPGFWKMYGRSEAIFARLLPQHRLLTGPLHRLYLQGRCLYEGGRMGFANFRQGWREGCALPLRPPARWDGESVDPVEIVRDL